MNTPFRFDGHGVNDSHGTRIATLYKPSGLYDERAPQIRADYDANGKLMAAAPELLEMLEQVTLFAASFTYAGNTLITQAGELIGKVRGVK